MRSLRWSIGEVTTTRFLGLPRTGQPAIFLVLPHCYYKNRLLWVESKGINEQAATQIRYGKNIIQADGRLHCISQMHGYEPTTPGWVGAPLAEPFQSLLRNQFIVFWEFNSRPFCRFSGFGRRGRYTATHYNKVAGLSLTAPKLIGRCSNQDVQFGGFVFFGEQASFYEHLIHSSRFQRCISWICYESKGAERCAIPACLSVRYIDSSCSQVWKQPTLASWVVASCMSRKHRDLDAGWNTRSCIGFTLSFAKDTLPRSHIWEKYLWYTTRQSAYITSIP